MALGNAEGERHGWRESFPPPQSRERAAPLWTCYTAQARAITELTAPDILNRGGVRDFQWTTFLTFLCADGGGGWAEDPDARSAPRLTQAILAFALQAI